MYERTLERGHGSAAKAEGDQLVLRVEKRLGESADSFRRVVHGARELEGDAIGAPIRSTAVREDRPPAGLHQAFDHRVGVLGCVVGLRYVRSRGDALGDLAETRDELRDVAVLRVVWNAPQVPDGFAPGIRDAARGPDVLDHRQIRLLRPRPLQEPVRDDAALQNLVLVMVRGDEAGHDDSARAVDDLGVGSSDGRCYLRDRLAVDQDVGLLEVAHLRVECEHDTAAQQNAALPSVADEVLRWRRGGRCAVGLGRRA